MKIRNLMLSVLGMALAIGGISFGSAIKTKSADAATSYDCVFGLNTANVEQRSYFSNDNPPTAYTGYVAYSDMSTTNNSLVSITGNGGKTITIKENAATNKCYGVYVPLHIFINNLPARTEIKYTMNVSVTLKGGTPDNVASLIFLKYGPSTTAGNSTKGTTETFAIPSDTGYSSALMGDSTHAIGIFNNSATTTNGSCQIAGLTSTNKSGSATNISCYYGGIFIGARKDSSSTHQMTATISANVTVSESTELPVSDSNGNFYKSFNAAVLGCADGSTITIYEDLVESYKVSVDKNITVNLNGHNISLYNGEYIEIKTGGKLKVTGTGRISSSNTTYGVIEVSGGELEIDTNAKIEGTSTNANAPGVYVNSGTMTTRGTIISSGPALHTHNATTRVEGGTITSKYKYGILMSNGNVYLYNSPAITGQECDFYIQSSYGKLHAANEAKTTQYSGSEITINSNFGTGFTTTIVYDVTAINYSKFTYVGNLSGYEIVYDSTNGVLKGGLIKRTVTYELTNCDFGDSHDTTTIYNSSFSAKFVPDEGYKITKEVVTVYIGSNEFTSYTLYNYSNYTLITISGAYLSAAVKIVINAALITSADRVSAFISGYLYMSKNNTNQCVTYYSPAKNAFNKLSDEDRELFMTDEAYADARARLIAWATHNGETIDTTTNKLVKASSNRTIVATSSNALIIVTASITFCGLLAAYFVLKKKKKN